MKDILPKKRIDWIEVLYAVFVNDDLRQDFVVYKKHHKKVKSLNKLAFNFLLTSKGRSFIRFVRENPERFTVAELSRIAHTTVGYLD